MDEPTKDKPEPKPLKTSDGASSLAYMPSADSDDTPEITMDFDRDSEKKTMADIASELAEDDTKTAAVKVGVNGKATKEPKGAKLAKAPVSKKEAADSLPDFPSDDEMPDMSQSEPPRDSAPPTRGGGGKRGLLIVLVFALVAAAVFGWLWLSGKAKQDELTAKVSQLESSSSHTSTTPAPSSSSSDTRLITELSLTYKLTDASLPLTYRYRETTDAEKKAHKVITFSTTDIVEAERAVSNSAPKCTAEFAPLGTFTSYATGDIYKGGKIEAQIPDNQTIFKIGDSYYVFETSQAPCSADKTVQAKITDGKTNIAATLKTLTEAQK